MTHYKLFYLIRSIVSLFATIGMNRIEFTSVVYRAREAWSLGFFLGPTTGYEKHPRVRIQEGKQGEQCPPPPVRIKNGGQT